MSSQFNLNYVLYAAIKISVKGNYVSFSSMRFMHMEKKFVKISFDIFFIIIYDELIIAVDI